MKHGEAKTFVVVDARMNDLHPPDAVRRASRDLAGRRNRRHPPAASRADVGRPGLESGDFRASTAIWWNRQAAHLLAVMSAGAYGAVQAGTYNTRALVPEVLVRWRMGAACPRLEVDQLIALDRMPNWL